MYNNIYKYVCKCVLPFDAVIGTAFNQLAVLLSGKNSHLDSIYYYQRRYSNSYDSYNNVNNNSNNNNNKSKRQQQQTARTTVLAKGDHIS